jgi:muramoyltetrapeptide carboxypeptidase LdcA involved in peptidoglycan recycling
MKMSKYSTEFLQENPFQSERKFEKLIKKKTQRYKTIESERVNQPVLRNPLDSKTIFCKIGGKDYNYILLDIRGRIFSFGSK